MENKYPLPPFSESLSSQWIGMVNGQILYPYMYPYQSLVPQPNHYLSDLVEFRHSLEILQIV